MVKNMAGIQPIPRMLVQLSNARHIDAGDGTTSIVLICGSPLGAEGRGQDILSARRLSPRCSSTPSPPLFRCLNTAKILVQLSDDQDIEAGDVTTSFVVICGSEIGAADK